jgi:hypothetical protein
MRKYIKNFNENFEVQYSDEQISEFIKNATKEASDTDQLIKMIGDYIVNLTIKYIVSNYEKNISKFDALKEATKKCFDKYNFYFNIIEKYDIFDAPKLIKELESKMDILDTNSQTLQELLEIFDDMMGAAKTIKNKNFPKLNLLM